VPRRAPACADADENHLFWFIDGNASLEMPAMVQYRAAEKPLLTKNGRITENSVSKFLADHPE
jgi:hypothetical protein